MPTTKLRAPANFAGLSLEGRSVDVAKDGSYHADHRDLAQLTAHGFTPWTDDPAGGDVKTMTREQIIEHAVAVTREKLGELDTETLRRQLLSVTGEPDAENLHVPTDAELAAAQVDANTMTPERIAGMKRNELFAYLAAEKVSAVPPIGNDKLREIALNTLATKRAA